MPELKPCPFCGGKQLFVGTIAEIEMMDEDNPNYLHSKEVYSVVCDYLKGGCGASTGGGARSEDEAIEAWNRRAEDGRD